MRFYIPSSVYYLLNIFSFFVNIHIIHSNNCTNTLPPDQTIFVFGDDIKPKYIKYVLELTEKPKPKICYVPTASADNEDNITYWNHITKNLSCEPSVLKIWVSSMQDTISFEETLLSMDAIIVGGGNTLNMLGIWQAQGIDTIMAKALEKGIILAGGSAGSICWFQNGVSDSRPVKLSLVKGLSLLPYSNCPHYSDSLRQEFFHQQIKDRNIQGGYASDDYSGILFKNGKLLKAVSINEFSNSYYITLKDGDIHSEKLVSEILIDKNALEENSYKKIELNENLKNISKDSSLLNAFIKSISESYGENHLSNVHVEKIFIYDNSVAGILNKHLPDFYIIWFFYNKNGYWESKGEDIGGQTFLQAEITFREKTLPILEKALKE